MVRLRLLEGRFGMRDFEGEGFGVGGLKRMDCGGWTFVGFSEAVLASRFSSCHEDCFKACN